MNSLAKQSQKLCVMSDSDDTDVLLLIPPDFFLADTASSCEELVNIQRKHKTKSEPINPCRLNSKSKIDLCILEGNSCSVEKYLASSNCKQYSGETSLQRSAPQMYHSTPKIDRFASSDYGKRKEDFIQEIDNHLQNVNGTTSNGDVRKLAVETIRKHNSLLDNRRMEFHESDRNLGHVSGGADTYNKFSRLSDWRNDVNRSTEMKKSLGVNDTLLSLNEIWDASGKTESATVHEERTRREVWFT